MAPSAKTTSIVVDIYDFDHTVYGGDSTLDFYWYVVRKQPSLLVYLPYQLLSALVYFVRLSNRTIFKRRFFVFLRGIKDIQNYVEEFWSNHEGRIGAWYGDRDHTSDVIISASPEFLLRPLFEKLNAHTLIATRMDSRTGVIEGVNCYGNEKLRRFRGVLPDVSVRSAYSDHVSDMPLLQLAQSAYVVVGDHIIPVEVYSNLSRIKRMLLQLR